MKNVTGRRVLTRAKPTSTVKMILFDSVRNNRNWLMRNPSSSPALSNLSVNQLKVSVYAFSVSPSLARSVSGSSVEREEEEEHSRKKCDMDRPNPAPVLARRFGVINDQLINYLPY